MASNGRTNKSGTAWFAACLCAAVITYLPTSQALAEQSDPDMQAGLTKVRVALALGGGGSKAAGHIGVLKVFAREGIPIDAIAGTSIGGTIGGLYAAGVPLHTIEQLVVSGKLRRAALPSIAKVIGLQLAHRILFWRTYYAGLLSGNGYRKFLARYCGKNQQIETMPTRFSAVACDLVTGSECDQTKGDLSHALVASSAMSPLFKPQQVGDKLLVDGGIVNNVPTTAARALGADVVVSVSVDSSLQPIPARSMTSLAKLTGRVADTYFWTKDEADIPKADVAIWVNEDGVTITARKKKTIEYAIAQGEKAAEQALPAIRAMIEQKSASRTASLRQPLQD